MVILAVIMVERTLMFQFLALSIENLQEGVAAALHGEVTVHGPAMVFAELESIVSLIVGKQIIDVFRTQFHGFPLEYLRTGFQTIAIGHFRALQKVLCIFGGALYFTAATGQKIAAEALVSKRRGPFVALLESR